MKHVLIATLFTCICHIAQTQNLKVLSEIGVAVVESKNSKNIALYTNAGLGTELNLKPLILDLSVSHGVYNYQSDNQNWESLFYNIRLFDLNLTAKEFIRLTDRSYLYGLIGPRLTVYYQKRVENYTTGVRWLEPNSIWLWGYSAEGGLRTHILGRTWFDVSISERRDVGRLNKDSDAYMKALRRALKIGFQFYFGKNTHNPGKKRPAPLKIY